MAVPSWTVTFNVQGNGSGDVSGLHYTGQQSVSGTASLNSPYPFGWTGNTDLSYFNFLVQSQDSDGTYTLEYSRNSNDDSWTDLFIDEESCMYRITATASIQATVTVQTKDATYTHTQPGGWGVAVSTVPLPSSGRVLSGSLAFTDIQIPLSPIPSSLSWNISPSKCEVTLPVFFNQGDPRWAGEQYDHSSSANPTIGRWGCAMTSMSMAMMYAGFTGNSLLVNPDPGSINNFMLQKDGDFIGSNVNWDAAVRDLSLGVLKFDGLGGSRSSIDDPVGAQNLLDRELCSDNPYPVIIGVKHCVDDKNQPRFPCHFVLVIGKEGNDYIIADPATGSKRSLMASYGADFTTRGIVKDSPGDISQRNLALDQNASMIVTDANGNQSQLNLALDQNASMIVTDANGNQAGINPVTGTILQQIPGSAYFMDQIQDASELNTPGPVDVAPTAHILQIQQPQQGSFHIVVNGKNQGPSTLVIRGFNQDGGAQNPIVAPGNAQPGSTLTYNVQFVSTPGSTCTFAISPAEQLFVSGSGTGSVSLATQSACTWSASSNATWLTITSSPIGSGNATINYSVADNPDTARRAGILTVAGQTLDVLQGASFLDVPPSYGFYNEIGKISAAAITIGCGNGLYCPDQTVTRGQMAAFLIRALYGETFTYTVTLYFSDVPADHVFFKYVQKMKDTGLTQASGTYSVDRIITRGETAAFLIRALYGETFTYMAAPYFSDVPASHVFFKYVQKMKDTGLTRTNATYSVDRNISRGEMAAFLTRAFLDAP